MTRAGGGEFNVSSIYTTINYRIPAKFGFGFTLVELMIVVAAVAIILTLALPVYSNYTIRGKVQAAISLAGNAQTAVAALCHGNKLLPELDNARAAYVFEPVDGLADLTISGNCAAPVITLTTQNTGAPADFPVTLTGTFSNDTQNFLWTCSSDAPKYQLPDHCRN